MRRRILLAGATGAIGRRLTRLLRDADLVVFGTTRSPAKAQELRALGIEPLVVDVFDAQALTDAVARARPDVVIHQLTELPAALPPDQMAAAAPRNARIRDEGTGNLVRAALAAGAKRFVAQSIAWAYAPGPLPRVIQRKPCRAAAIALSLFSAKISRISGRGSAASRTMLSSVFRRAAMARGLAPDRTGL